MRESLQLVPELRDAIRDEIAERIEAHQTTIARLKTARAMFADGSPQPPPLVMLAHGDSWFDYPLSGNSLSLSPTDIIAQLSSSGAEILNLSHFGDATTVEMSLSKQQLLIVALQDEDNWLNGGPDAILFSGGGDDIAGDPFCIYLNYASDGGPGLIPGLNDARLRDALDMIRASYLDLFAFRDRYAGGVPIFGHDYDFPIPNGVHPACAGPWLKPALDFCGWNLGQGTTIVHQILVEFGQMLVKLAADPANNFTLIDTQGKLNPASDWANELHPYPEGFQKLAAVFLTILRARFPGQI